MNLITSFFDRVDEKHTDILFDDPELEMPKTIIALNALGKVRKLGVQSPKNRYTFLVLYLLFTFTGKVKYWITKEVILSNDYKTYNTH